MNNQKEIPTFANIPINNKQYYESTHYLKKSEIIQSNNPIISENQKDINTANNLKIDDLNKSTSNEAKTRKLYVELEDGKKVIQPEKYCKNRVQTNQYSLITFLPLALINQFKIVFNWLFLVTTILSMTSLSNQTALSNLTPFCVVLIISLIREAIEDYKKYKDDERINKTKVLIYKPPSFMKTESKNVKVGNIIKIKKGQIIPADVLIIKTSLENGFCYMQTTNLDGESAFKPREAIALSQKTIDINKPITFSNLLTSVNENCYIEVDVPSKDIYKIEGIISFKNKKFPFDIKNVLLKGAKLKNVKFAYGIAIYTGKDTKLMQNINRSSLKISDIDYILGKIIIIMIIIFLIMSIICTILGIKFRDDNTPDYDNNERNAEYIYYFRKGNSSKKALESAKIFVGHFMNYSGIIPISIIIVNTVIKIFQTAFLNYSPRYKELPEDKIECYSTNLIEQLGKVKYIFSDKTGTLTKNEMLFKGCSIFTKLFDESIINPLYKQKALMPLPSDFDPDISVTKKSITKAKSVYNSAASTTENDSPQLKTSAISPDFCLDYFYQCLKNKNSLIEVDNKNNCPFKTEYEAIEQFLLNIVINHDVLCEKKSHSDAHDYQGSSPDEVALVSSAEELGFTFINRENGIITIEIFDQNINQNEVRQFQILQKFDFTSERQKSSIIVKDLLANKIIIYIKGSDKKIFSSIDQYSIQNLIKKTSEHTEYFARQGLRTLCYSFKYIDEKEYNLWENNYKNLKLRAIKDKSLNTELDILIEKIEENATLLGATAVEDKLQDNVKRDIEDFIEAGINFWMITGDKMATAESIGYSCGIISGDSEVYKIKDTKDNNAVYKEISKIKYKINKQNEELSDITKTHIEKLLSEDKTNINNYKKDNEIIKKIEKEYNIYDPNSYAYQYYNFNYNRFHYGANFIGMYPPTPEQYEIMNNNTSSTKNFNVRNYMDINNVNSDEITEISLKTANANDKISVTQQEVFDYMIKNNKDKNSSINNKYEEISFLEGRVKNFDDNQNPSEKNLDEQDTGTVINSRMELNDKLKEEKESEIFINNCEKIITDKNSQLETTKKFNKYFDYCQRKLYEYSIKNSRRFCLFKWKYMYEQRETENFAQMQKNIKSKYTIIVEGNAINICIKDEKISNIFLELIKNSRSLICCRSSPSQKSQIVEFVKKNTEDLTLAIGDGGNDVNMIRMAHVGVGIFGKEGYEAAYSSDYAISRFKFLKTLLFIDGRFSLKRNAYFNYHYFYKNILYTFPRFWNQIDAGYAGNNLYDDWYSMGFNSYFTVAPLSCRSAIEEDFDPDFSEFNSKQKKYLKYLYPDIYREFRDSKPFNMLKFMVVFFIAVIFSVQSYYITVYSLYNCSYGNKGFNYSYWDASLIIFLSIVLAHFFYIFKDTMYYTNFAWFWYILQIIVIIGVLVVYNAIDLHTGMDNTLYFVMGNLNFWLTLILITAIECVPFYILRQAEFFFGGFIVDKIKRGHIKDLYVEKFYRKKVEEMTIITRNVAKFMKLYKSDQCDNLADQQMKKIVEEFKEQRKIKKMENSKIIKNLKINH